MVVSCPKCKVKLKVDETKLSPEGTRFKCPKCATVLAVKKPAAQTTQALNPRKIIVASSKPEILQTCSSVLSGGGYEVITAADGIETMVKALKELPFLAVVEVALPKIYGFEVCKRLKARAETKDMKFILVPAIHDRAKYRREPVSLYGADDYLEETDLQAHLAEKVDQLKSGKKPEEPAVPQKPAAEMEAPSQRESGTPAPPAPAAPAAPAAAASPAATKPQAAPPQGTQDERVERARRLARTIVNDIYLYNTAKFDEAIRTNSVQTVFAADFKEGLKLYDQRIAAEVRAMGDFFSEAVENFVRQKKA